MMPLVTSALFAKRNGRGRRGGGRPSAREVKQKSALVTAKAFGNNFPSFKDVWQLVCGFAQRVGGNMRVIL